MPPLVLETDLDRRRHGEAEIRRSHRLARRRAIQAARAGAAGTHQSAQPAVTTEAAR